MGLAGVARSLKADLGHFDRALTRRVGTVPAVRLSRERAGIVDAVIASLFAPFAGRPLALMATGGFGRFDLTPGSDVDLLLVHRSDDEDVEGAVAALLYPLWDAGLRVSHAVRTPEQCRVECATRLESLTAMASARLIAGDREVASSASDRAVRVARDDPVGFITKLSESREERKRRFGRVDHLLEPDLKESVGGLRDAHLVEWIAWAFPELGDGTAPASSPLADVRIALHIANGGTSNRLLAEHHDHVVRLLGMNDEPGWEARDALIRDTSARGREAARRAERSLQAAGARIEAGRPEPSTTVTIPPTGPLRFGGPWPPSFLTWFLEMLRDGRRVDLAFPAWADLRAAIPEWEDVRGRPQRDPYHRYPVDVHLMATVEEAARLLKNADEPFARAAASVSDPDALVLSALLHDIGKVGTGSHVPAGVRVAAQVLDRAGVRGRLRGDVLFLVGEHLLLSDSATRRNIHDEDLVMRIAAKIGTAERLAMLYLLTLADAQATGPSACTPWRMNLIRDLVSKVSQVIERGHADLGRPRRLERAETAVRRALSRESAEAVEGFLRSVPSAYLLWVDASDVPTHFRLLSRQLDPGEVRTDIRSGRTPETHLITAVAVDRLGLLADLAGALSASGLSILSAHAFTSDRGVALDEFEVRGAFEPDVSEERWERFQSVLNQTSRGADLERKLRSIRAYYRTPGADTPVSVRIDQESSDFFTVVEVEGPDRIGLLFDLARTFARLHVDVHLAKVATYGPRVVDVFYVTDEAGEKLEGGGLLAELEGHLVRAASG